MKIWDRALLCAVFIGKVKRSPRMLFVPELLDQFRV